MQTSYISVREVATTLGVSEWTIRRLIKTGELRAARIGGMLRVSQADLADYLERAQEVVL